MNDPRNRRSIALWKQAIKDLVAYRLLEGQNEFIEVTAKGFEVADLLKKR